MIPDQGRDKNLHQDLSAAAFPVDAPDLGLPMRGGSRNFRDPGNPKSPMPPGAAWSCAGCEIALFAIPISVL